MKWFERRPQAVTMNVRQRATDALTALNLHWAGVALLGLVNLYLIVHTVVLYQQAKGQDADAVAKQEVALKTAKIQARPLEGLDAKLKRANGDADTFYEERLPLSYSEVVTELGALSTRDKVRLARVQYVQSAVAGDAAGQLVQVQMDAGLTGDYRSLVTFINGLERDRVFFLINSVTLTGQQTGTVNLRVRITTYLRGAEATAEIERVAALATAAPGETGGQGAAR